MAECRPWEGGERKHGRLSPQNRRGRDRRNSHRLDLDLGARLISVDLQEHVFEELNEKPDVSDDPRFQAVVAAKDESMKNLTDEHARREALRVNHADSPNLQVMIAAFNTAAEKQRDQKEEEWSNRIAEVENKIVEELGAKAELETELGELSWSGLGSDGPGDLINGREANVSEAGAPAREDTEEKKRREPELDL